MLSNGKPSKAIIYIRLSREDGELGESNSVTNQRDLIMAYANSRDDIAIIGEQVDDGYSGVTFDRPGLNALMDVLKEGRADCVIVKDLSRFGRNYIEAGRYIEQIFPIMGIRFIAINDQIDTARDATYTDGILVPFKNLMNDAYCRDISIKIRTQLAVRQERGDFVAAFPVFGYCRNETEKHKLEIDPVAAEIVRDIFKMRISGQNNHAIANHLNESGMPSPSAYKALCQSNYKTPFQESAYPKWTHTAVGRILTNEIYTGTMVQGKNTTISYKLKQRQLKPKENWIRVENTHEPIIPPQDFSIVAQMLLQDTRTSPKANSLYLLSGMLKCGTCGANLVRRPATSRGKTYGYFVCSTHKSDKTACTSHRVAEKQVESALLAHIRQHIESLCILQNILDEIAHEAMDASELKAHDKVLTQKQKELARYKHLRITVYEDVKEGFITQDEYLEMKEIYEKSLQRT